MMLKSHIYFPPRKLVCDLVVVHRDMKLSNILLDGDIEARVVDFRVAKLIECDESMSVIAGSYAYIAHGKFIPEFGALIHEKSSNSTQFIDFKGYWDDFSIKIREDEIPSATCPRCPFSILNGFDFVFGAVDSLLTRTDVGTCVPLCQILHCLLLILQLVDIVLFIFESGCSKHMTGNLKLLINFMEKFLGTVKFGNDQIASILGYGDLVQEAVMIKRVYYVEGLNHNLFSIGSRGTDLYLITLQDINSPNLICLMAKAISSQAWLRHRRLSHLNFDTINLLSKNDIVVGLPKLKFVKDHLCSSCELGKAKRKCFHTKLTPSSKRRLKKYQEKDKIGSKPDKNGKRVEAKKSLKQLQWIEREKLNKT
uniref:Protein kinase domain-containing protein n=1 Tax=Tanacetum cinerariifolium TaxID=118510 RepID=A0A6L2KN63_TANCI|nr:hypothetical protein [Tanacetum cinerariifolium]